MSRYFIAIILFSLSVKVFADCTPADMSLIGFTPSSVDLTTSSTATVDYQTSHGPFTGTDRCYYFGYMDYGAGTSWATRYLTHADSGTTIPFNVYSRAAMNNGQRIRLPADATANRHVIYRDPQFFNPSGSTVTNTNTFYVRLGTLPTSLPPGTYTESLIFRVAARLTNPPSGDWGLWPVVLSRGVTFMYIVEKELSLSLVASGGVFDAFSTARLMSFGDLESFETKTADIIIKTNVGYRLSASSTNDGSLNHTSGSSIPYTMRVAGTAVNLTGSSGAPVVISTDPADSPALGFVLPLEVEIGSVTGAEPGGEYSDIISFSIEAF